MIRRLMFSCLIVIITSTLALFSVVEASNTPQITQATVTREQFMSMILNALHIKVQPAQEGEPNYNPIINAATAHGLYKEGDYVKGWSLPITRGEMAITLERATHDASYKAQIAEISRLELPTEYTRLRELEKMYDKMDTKQRIYETVRRGLLSGSGTGELALGSTVSLANATAVIGRVDSFNQGIFLKADPRALAVAEVYWHATNLFTAWPNFLGSEQAYKFDVSMLEYESNMFKGSITGLYIIDADDPKDPFRSTIPFPLQELYRFESGNAAFPLSELRDAYIIVYTQAGNQVKVPTWKKPVRFQVTISGIGINPVNNLLMTSKSERDARNERVDQGALESLQLVEHKAITKEQKAIASHHVGGILLDNSLQNYIGMYVLPKHNLKVESTIELRIRPIVSHDMLKNRILRLTPNGVYKLRPDQGNEYLYTLPVLN